MIALPYSDCLLTLSNLTSISAKLVKTGWDLKNIVKVWTFVYNCIIRRAEVNFECLENREKQQKAQGKDPRSGAQTPIV